MTYNKLVHYPFEGIVEKREDVNDPNSFKKDIEYVSAYYEKISSEERNKKTDLGPNGEILRQEYGDEIAKFEIERLMNEFTHLENIENADLRFAILTYYLNVGDYKAVLEIIKRYKENYPDFYEKYRNTINDIFLKTAKEEQDRYYGD
jgi:hypothetical protein